MTNKIHYDPRRFKHHSPVQDALRVVIWSASLVIIGAVVGCTVTAGAEPREPLLLNGALGAERNVTQEHAFPHSDGDYPEQPVKKSFRAINPDAGALASVALGEARNQPEIGQIATMWVIKNAAEKRGISVAQEAFRPKRISAFNKGDPNVRVVAEASSTQRADWLEMYNLALEVLTGNIEDPTMGADHYCKKGHDKCWWKVGMELTAVIGAHEFYRS